MRRATCGSVIGRSAVAAVGGLHFGASVSGHMMMSSAPATTSRRFNASAPPQRVAVGKKDKGAGATTTSVPTTKAMVTVVGAIHDLSQGFVTMKGPNRDISPTKLSSAPLPGSAASQRPSDHGSQESVLQFVVTTNQLGDGSLLDNTPALQPPETSPTESFPPPAAMSVTSFRDACIRKEQFVVRCFGDEEDLSALRLCLLDGSVVRVRGALRLNRQDKELASLPAGAVAGGGVGSGSSQNPAARGGLYGRRGNTSAANPTPSTPTPAAAPAQGSNSSTGADSGSILKKILGITTTTPSTTTTATTTTNEAVPPQVQAPGGGDEMRYFPYLHVQLPSTKAVEKEEGAALRPLGELTVLHRRP